MGFDIGNVRKMIKAAGKESCRIEAFAALRGEKEPEKSNDSLSSRTANGAIYPPHNNADVPPLRRAGIGNQRSYLSNHSGAFGPGGTTTLRTTYQGRQLPALNLAGIPADRKDKER
jgi:hypothetical protein